jgi:hypothetical protein
MRRYHLHPYLTSKGTPLTLGELNDSVLLITPRKHATRPYRRHPRPDPNAPHKPKTAYVLFGEYVRRDTTTSHLSFGEMAKETGRRWQDLPYKERVDTWEKPVSDKMEDYAAEVDQYKDTESYRNHQKYLKDFHQAHRKPESTELLDNESSPMSPHFGQPPALPGVDRFQVPNQDNTPDSASFDSLILSNRSRDLQPGRVEAEGSLDNMAIIDALPAEGITHSIVEAFLHGTGSLLYLWDHDDAANLVRSVYNLKSNTPQLDAIEVLAMSAVGSYCDAELQKGSAQEEFLDIFIGVLSSYSEICDLRLMRLYTCLAICRFTNDIENARESICK